MPMMRSLKYLSTIAALFALSDSGAASATDWWVEGHVTQVEASYLPNQVPFLLDVAAGNCPAGSMLFWVANGADSTAKAANAQGVLSVLMTARTTGRAIAIGGLNAGCVVQYIWLK